MTTMATSIAFSFALRCPPLPASSSVARITHSTVQFSKFSKKTPLTLLSSSHNIAGFNPLPKRINNTHVSRSSNQHQTLTVVAHTGYKMKTHKASAKRFRVTGTGKIMRRRAGKQHLLRKKSTKRRVRLSKTQQVNRCDYNNVIGALPYLKVKRSN